ncbi:MAG TPA: DUF6600 domain-containing protein, partial [Steroidobacteraceae bacterium]|nr:DUF6600 domain-containing protein [Steroidobacteraceae bacterium]
MSTHRASTYLAALTLLAVAAAGGALAQEADPPGRAARLGYLEGSVSLEPAGLDEWTAAERNRPLTTGDRLWTDQNAVAEVDLGDSVIRLGGMTGFAFLNLEDSFAQLQLTAGVLIVRVWGSAGAANSYEIDTPNLALSLQQPGVYRVEVDEPGGTTTVKVSEGQALAIGTDQSVPITTQQVMTFAGTTSLSYSAANLAPPDDLDNWSATRDRQVQESTSSQYVADEIPGSDALDDNGRWMQTPEYGFVWMPIVMATSWAPYRFGHWVFIAPWGWTWVDEAPWGYAPFHYGRWAQLSGMWCWIPGPRNARPVYAPALVAWTGRASAPGGNVGWLPLGPHEVYAPAYAVSADYLRNVNLSNTTVSSTRAITDVYQRRVTNIHYMNSTAAAITAVPQSVFTSAQRVSGHTVPVSAAALPGLTANAAAPSIAPVRQSVLGSGVGLKRRPPSMIVNRPVVANTPPPRAPAPFEKQLAAIQANGGRPLAASQLAHLGPGTTTAQVRLINPRGMRAAPQPHEPSLGERARSLATPSLPPASGTATTTRRFTNSPPAAPMPPPRTDRPPGAMQGTFSTYDPGHSPEHPATEQAYRTETATPPTERSPVQVERVPQ